MSTGCGTFHLRTALLAVLCTLPATASLGQINTGEIGGVVRDTSGAVLPGATVTATHAATGIIVERVTDGEGRFFLPALRIGTWDVEARLAGLSPQTHADRARSRPHADPRVRARRAGPDRAGRGAAHRCRCCRSTTAEISDVIENREVVQLPLNGRNFLALAQLSDAVVIPPGGTRGEALQQAGPLPNVGGQRSGHNIYLLDGTKVTDELFNNLVINPSVDSIEEFKIQKSMYAAEFGGKASALINVVTRAGSNAFRGSAFEFHRDDAFDSPNYFRPVGAAVPPLRQDQFGGTLGGPLRRNRSFFFGSFEGLRMKRSLTRTFSVPTAAVRAGNFAGLAPICDPLTIPTTGTCAPFANNQIPAARIDPIATALLQHVPAADVRRQHAEPDGRRGAGPRSQSVQRAARPSVDRLGPAARSLQHVRRRRNAALRHQRAAGDARAGVRTLADDAHTQPGREPHARLRHVAAERVALRMDDGRRAARSAGTAAIRSRSDVGLLGVTTDPRDMGFPQISTGGLYSTFGDPTIFTTRDNQHFELFDNVTLDRGAHRLKFGAYYFHLQLRRNSRTTRAARSPLPDSSPGTRSPTSSSVTRRPRSRASDAATRTAGRTGCTSTRRTTGRPASNLTFNLGLRYEFNQHMYDVDNRLSSIDLGRRPLRDRQRRRRHDPSRAAARCLDRSRFRT